MITIQFVESLGLWQVKRDGVVVGEASSQAAAWRIADRELRELVDKNALPS